MTYTYDRRKYKIASNFDSMAIGVEAILSQKNIKNELDLRLNLSTTRFQKFGSNASSTKLYT